MPVSSDRGTSMGRWLLVACCCVGCGVAGCSPEQAGRGLDASNRPMSPVASPAPVAAPTPSATPPPTPSPESEPAAPAPAPPPILSNSLAGALREGWITIQETDDATQRAWVEGSVEGVDRLVINTKNIRRFQLDLTRLRVNWEERIVLRLDGYNSELTRKRWPKLDFLRNASGAWTVVDE